MFASKPRKVSLTLFCYLALVLAIATVAQADSTPHHLVARDHISLNRMIKKRAPGLGDLIPGTNGAAGDPPTFSGTTSAGESATVSSTAASSSATSQSSSSASASSSATSTSASQTSASSSVASSSSSSSSSTSSSSTSSSATSSSTQSSSTTASSTSTSATSAATQPTDTQDTQPSQSADTSNNNNDNADGSDSSASQSQSRVTRTVTSPAASATNSDSAQTVSGATAPQTKAGLTVVIVIASCVGAIAIGWTIIRKWKFKPSSTFEDRMAPIDWHTAGAQDDGIPGLQRNVSTASHGSFHSASHSDESYGHGSSGYGAGYGARHGTTNLQPVPDHDFTAGPTTLAPVGGYADLARGPSPGPPMTELSRGPSMNNSGYGATGYNGRY